MNSNKVKRLTRKLAACKRRAAELHAAGDFKGWSRYMRACKGAKAQLKMAAFILHASLYYRGATAVSPYSI